MTGKLDVLANISVIALRPNTELNPVENIWQFMRDNWLSNRGLHFLRQHRRSLLRGVEHAHRAAMADHDHQTPQMGPWVMINAG